MKNDNRDLETREIVMDLKMKLNDEDQKMISDRQIVTKSPPESIDFLDLQADVAVSLEHNQAQRVYKINYDKFNEGVNLCKCCNLPLHKENIVENFPLFGDITELNQVSLSITLYLHFIRFAFICIAIVVGMNSGLQFYVSNNYYNITYDYCKTNLNSNITNCSRVIDIEFNDWLFISSYHNYELYYNLTKMKYGNKNIIEYFDYSFINFLCMIVISIVNYLYMIIVNNIVVEGKIQKISPSNYTLMIRNLPVEIENFEALKKDLTLDHLTPSEIIFTLKINGFCELKAKYLDTLRKYEYCNYRKITVFETARCCLCCEICECTKCIDRHTISNLTTELQEMKVQLNNLLIDLKDPSKFSQNFSRTGFITFNDDDDTIKYYNLFPNSIIGYIIALVRFIITNYLCSFFYDERTKKRNKKTVMLQVERASEPEEIIWQNLEITTLNSKLRKIIIYFSFLFFFGIALAIMYGLNIAQLKLHSSNNKNVNYLISFIYAVIVHFLNYLMGKLILYLVEKERLPTINDYYIAHSTKLTISSFINLAIIPLIANIISGQFDTHPEILLNQILLVIIYNAVVIPFLNFFPPFYYYLKCFRASLIKRESENSYININQKQSSEIFENPGFEFSFKFSYITSTVLITFFYVPLLPAGTFITLFGFSVFYISERINTVRFYRPPEILNEKLALYYFNFFKGVLFIYALSTYIFFSNMFPNWCIVNITVFTVYMILPIHTFMIPNLSTVSEEDMITENYNESSIDFHNDYERTNPMTKKRGYEKYFERLYNAGELSSKEFKVLIEELEQNEHIYLEEFFKHNCSFQRFKENLERKNYMKTFFQNYIDNINFTPQTDNFRDKNFYVNLIHNNVFSATKNRHNKKFFTKLKLNQERTLKKPATQGEAAKTPDDDADLSFFQKNFDVPRENSVDMKNNKQDDGLINQVEMAELNKSGKDNSNFSNNEFAIIMK